jgi:drug/metabolite transporter (DMT)-like permease
LVLLAFFCLGICWGTAYLFIKLGLTTLQPLSLIALRLIVGTLTTFIILSWKKVAIPASFSVWRHFICMGLINVLCPWILITWSMSGDMGVNSGVAAIINSMTPIFGLFISALCFKAEKITYNKILGIIVSFGGILILLGHTLSRIGIEGIPRYIALASAAASYAAAAAYAKKNLQLFNPILKTFAQLLVACFIACLVAPVFEDVSSQTLSSTSLFAVIWLGIVASCIAYMLYFFIIEKWGATRALTVTYLFPIVAVTTGTIFLNEQLSWRLVFGGIFVLLGIFLINWSGFKALDRNDKYSAE